MNWSGSGWGTEGPSEELFFRGSRWLRLQYPQWSLFGDERWVGCLFSSDSCVSRLVLPSPPKGLICTSVLILGSVFGGILRHLCSLEKVICVPWKRLSFSFLILNTHGMVIFCPTQHRLQTEKKETLLYFFILFLKCILLFKKIDTCMCTCVCVCWVHILSTMSKKARRRLQIFWNCSSRLWVAQCGHWGPRSSERSVSVLKFWAISPVPFAFFNTEWDHFY